MRHQNSKDIKPPSEAELKHMEEVMGMPPYRVEKDPRRQYGTYTQIPVTAVWLRRLGNEAQVLLEINDEWRLVIQEYYDGNFSHIAECHDDGSRWPPDPIKSGVRE